MSKFCGKCGTENKDEYSFCKRCGTPLTYGRKEYSNQSNDGGMAEYDGLSFDEVQTAVGSNSEKIIKKFNNMAQADSKVSWCWPVAVMSYFFGLFGATIWFFYRKMYKTAIICLALAIALSVGKFFISKEPMTEYVKGIISISDEMTHKIQESKDNTDDGNAVSDIYNEFMNEFSEYVTKYSQSNRLRYSSMLDMAERYISTIMFGMFALYLYKKHIIKKSKKLKAKFSDEVSFKNALARSGGTSGGLAALAVFIYIFSSIVPSLALIIMIK